MSIFLHDNPLQGAAQVTDSDWVKPGCGQAAASELQKDHVNRQTVAKLEVQVKLPAANVHDPIGVHC